MPQFVVVGAGPAGCTAALRAARTPDVQVTVIEKRPFDSIFSSRNSARSYPMVLSGRALRTFTELELDLPCTREPYYGMQFMPSNGTMSMPDPETCCLVSRSQLAMNLLYEVASHPNISLHFSSTVREIDLPKQCLTLQQSSSTTEDSALVLQHLVGETSAETAQHGALYHASQPLRAAEHASSGKQRASELAEHSDSDASTPALSVLSRQASSSSAPSERSSDGSEALSDEAQPTPSSHLDHAAAPPPMSSTRMAGMQAALAVQAKHQTDLPETLEYDLLIAADGANSQIRDTLVEQGVLTMEEMFARRRFGYKTFTDIRIPASAHSEVGLYPFVDSSLSSNQKLFFISAEVEAPDGTRDTCSVLLKEPCMHTLLRGRSPAAVSQMGDVPSGPAAVSEPWGPSVRGVQGTSDIKVVVRRSDSDHVCGMVPGSAAELGAEISPQRLGDLFGAALPAWFLQPLCEQVNAQPLSPFGAICRCSQMHGPGVVLLGDSGHAVTSGFGQGCNMALESVRVFGEVLEGSGGAVGEVPQRFTAARQRDTRAMQDLECMNMLMQGGDSESAELSMQVHARVALGAATLVGFAQWKLLPNRYRMIPVYAMMYDATVPYSEVLEYVNRMGRGAYVVLGTVAVAIGYNLVQVISAAL